MSLDLSPAEIERFWARVQRGDPEDCWPWQGEKNNQGYGRFAKWRSGQRQRPLAHRVAYQLVAGDCGDMCLLHSCDNPPCCNPGHLRPGTQLDNIQDALAKGRNSPPPHGLGESASHVRLTEADVHAMRRRYAAGGITQAQLGAEVGMHQSAISAIIRGASWSHLPLTGGTTPDDRRAMIRRRAAA